MIDVLVTGWHVVAVVAVALGIFAAGYKVGMRDYKRIKRIYERRQ